MQLFTQSAFLQSLAYSLIASVWQMGLLWFAVTSIVKIFDLSSKQKFNIAFTAHLAGLVLFIVTLINNLNSGGAPFFASVASKNRLSELNYYLNLSLPFVAMLYLLVLFYKTGRLIFFYNDSQRIKNNQVSKIAAVNRIFVQEMSELLSLKRKVKIYLSSKINCPLTVGFLKPVILIPVAAVNHLTTEQMEAVILHELAHIKRADYLLFIFQNIIEKIFFFNIFSKFLGDIIERERENACDDWVLQFRYNSMHYAEALFKLGRLKALPAFAMAASGKKDSLLLIRIKRLLHNSDNSNTNSSFVLSLLFMMITSCLFLSFSAKPVSPKTTMHIKNEIQQTPNANIAYYQNALPIETNKVQQLEKNVAPQAETKIASITKKEVKQKIKDEVNKEIETQLIHPNYIVNVSQALDSLNVSVPTPAISSQIVVTPELYQKAMSYQNFKTIENMLAASGNSINITESDLTKDSYRKEITIESMDKNGNKHVYRVIVELYQ